MRWLILGRRQVSDSTEIRLPLYLRADGAQDTAAVLESSIFTLTACGRSCGCSIHSPSGPATHAHVTSAPSAG